MCLLYNFCRQIHMPLATFSQAQSLHILLASVYSHVTQTRGSRLECIFCVPHKTLHPLRRVPYFLQHSTQPCADTPSSPSPVPRSLQHCHDLRPLKRGTSAERPPPTTFWMAGHRPVRPHERSLEPLTETDGDETMVDSPGDDDAGDELSQSVNPTDEAIGSRDCYPRSMWSLSVSRLVPRLCCWHWAVRRSQTTA